VSKKVTIRMDENLYEDLYEESAKYGYRSFSSYICKLLKERNVVEIAGGNELAATLHKIRAMDSGDLRLAVRRDRLCQLYDSLMIEIENLSSCIKSLTM